MPKATVHGGRSNAWKRPKCPLCGSQACLAQSPTVCRHTRRPRPAAPPVGEQGLELVAVPAGTQVVSAADALVGAGADPVDVAAAVAELGEAEDQAADWAAANPSLGEPVTAPVDEAPPAGTAPVVLAWVGDNPGRAARALAAEQARERPRSTLLAELTRRAG